MRKSDLSPSLLSAWFWATRPFSLQASVVPVLVGSALALEIGNLDWLLFIMALLGSVSIQIATNLTDEYWDHTRTLSSHKFLAPHKVIQRGLLSSHSVLVGMFIAFGVGIGIGLYITLKVGWPILAIGLVSVTVAYLYSGGRYTIGQSGLGEFTVFIFMGPVMVMAAYYTQTQVISWSTFAASMPVAFLVTAILHCNNLRDIEEDREEGKRTLATALGINSGRRIYVGMLVCTYGSLIVLAATGVFHPLSLVALCTVPWAFSTIRKLWKSTDRMTLNVVMVGTARTHGLMGITLAGGLALSAAI